MQKWQSISSLGSKVIFFNFMDRADENFQTKQLLRHLPRTKETIYLTVVLKKRSLKAVYNGICIKPQWLGIHSILRTDRQNK